MATVKEAASELICVLTLSVFWEEDVIAPHPTSTPAQKVSITQQMSMHEEDGFLRWPPWQTARTIGFRVPLLRRSG
jgi:hypothetical protein